MTRNGGPAFPVTPEHQPRLNGYGGLGMTLRDYFAGQAIAALIFESTDEVIDKLEGESNHQALVRAWSGRTSVAYAVADAMLAERDK